MGTTAVLMAMMRLLPASAGLLPMTALISHPRRRGTKALMAPRMMSRAMAQMMVSHSWLYLLFVFTVDYIMELTLMVIVPLHAHTLHPSDRSQVEQMHQLEKEPTFDDVLQSYVEAGNRLRAAKHDHQEAEKKLRLHITTMEEEIRHKVEELPIVGQGLPDGDDDLIGRLRSGIDGLVDVSDIRKEMAATRESIKAELVHLEQLLESTEASRVQMESGAVVCEAFGNVVTIIRGEIIKGDRRCKTMEAAIKISEEYEPRRVELYSLRRKFDDVVRAQEDAAGGAQGDAIVV